MLLLARQSLLRLQVSEASEGALLGQTIHMHLQPGTQRARVTKSHGVTQDKVCCLKQAALLHASPSLGGFPFTFLNFLWPWEAAKSPLHPPPQVLLGVCTVGWGSGHIHAVSAWDLHSPSPCMMDYGVRSSPALKWHGLCETAC